MKEEIKLESLKYRYVGGLKEELAFLDGAEWMLNQFNGISPSTVTEMIEELREKYRKYTEWITNMKDNRAKEWDKSPDGEIYLLDQMIARTAETVIDIREVLSKADKELNNK